MRVNQNGEEIKEETIMVPECFQSDAEVRDAILLLAEHLKMDFVRTNATKHGDTILELRRQD